MSWGYEGSKRLQEVDVDAFPRLRLSILLPLADMDNYGGLGRDSTTSAREPPPSFSDYAINSRQTARRARPCAIHVLPSRPRRLFSQLLSVLCASPRRALIHPRKRRAFRVSSRELQVQCSFRAAACFVHVCNEKEKQGKLPLRGSTCKEKSRRVERQRRR